MIAEAGNFPDLARFYLDEVVRRGLRLIATILRRGIERGEFRAVDVDHAVFCVIAPMLIAALWKNSLEPHDERAVGHAGAGAGAPRSAAARPGGRRAMTWLHDAIVWLGGLLIALAAAIGLGGDRGPLHVQGYVEGEYVYVGAPVAGRLETLHVARGAQVAAGAPLFQLDSLQRAARPGRGCRPTGARRGQPRQPQERQAPVGDRVDRGAAGPGGSHAPVVRGRR